ncbi:MAG: phosphoribosylglycinamide formyltransferase [Proteobacteria bacterium]|nr:phosphoribosylglycinamide formyltransferase [Pseudomonadota bacterium]MBU4469731.1 phosphoribosylglycinamide formyltransferase [Pseudomonadota bacterium]MCG2753889.1 phosphoribosylglycinamide formyltransferase [Desulfobacteraceae bacterium]
MSDKIKIGVLLSGGGSNLQAIIDACVSGEILGDISFVGSDNPSAYGLSRAAKHHIPSFVVDYRTLIQDYKNNPETFSLPEDFHLDTVREKQTLFQRNATRETVDFFLRSRALAEKRVLDHAKAHGFDLIILAGFMRKLTPYFIDGVNLDRNPPGIMNIHPALLPAFPGEDGYGDTFRYGCKIGGCTVHFVDYGEDSGPIIGQRTFPVSDRDTLEEIQERGLQMEWQLYPECIRLFAENRLRVETRTHDPGKGKILSRAIVKIL